MQTICSLGASSPEKCGLDFSGPSVLLSWGRQLWTDWWLRGCLRRSPTTATQNTKYISRLDSATGKWFNIYFLSFPIRRLKREPFLQMGLQERGYLDLGYASPNTQNGSFI